jgi:hypothetical protein
MVDFNSVIAADNIRLARSKNLVSLADGTYNIIQLPRYSFVKDVWLYISTAYAGGDGVATVGFTGNGETADPDAFINGVWAAATVTGVKRMTAGYGAWAQGKWFDTASGQITITLDDLAATTLLKGVVFVEYTVIH